MAALLREEILSLALESIAEGVYSLDGKGRIAFWNKGAERITGYSREESVGSSSSEDFLGHADEGGKPVRAEDCPAAATMSDGRARDAELYLRHKDGHRVPVGVRSLPVKDPKGKTVGAIEIFTDRSERGALLTELETLRKEVLTDALTGLGNRRYAEISLGSALGELVVGAAAFGLLILDIDNFKLVNDRYGHAIGDRVLRMIGWTLANAVRRNDAAARWGGEEFVVICPRIALGVLAEVAERVRAIVARSRIGLDDGRKISCTVSVGGALARRGDSLETLVARADERMYACKAAGRNRAEVGE